MPNFDLGNYQFGFHDPGKPVFTTPKGLSKNVVEEISRMKNEPEWMRERRLKALEIFYAKPMPQWGGNLNNINFDDIYYYVKPVENQASSWEGLPEDIRNTYEKIGIPEAEKKFLAGVGAQYDCLTEDALVFGNPSMTPIKDIKPGSYVYALNEQTKKLEKQKVLGIACKGKRSVYELKVAGRKIKCTINHPLLTLKYAKPPNKQRGKFHVGWEYFCNLKVGDYIAIIKDIPDTGVPYEMPTISLIKKYVGRNHLGSFPVTADYLYTRSQKNLTLPKISSDNLLWLFGLYLGDGYITKKNSHDEREVLNIAIPITQAEIREKVKKVLKEIFCYELNDQKEKYNIRIDSQPIIDLFKQLGLKGNARTKSVPDWILHLPKSQKLAFIAGLVDSDGTVRKTKKNCDIYITSVNRAMLEKVQMLGITCGLHVTGIHKFIYTPDVKDKERKLEGYRLQITGDLTLLKKYSLKVKSRFIPRAYYHTYGSHHKSPITNYISDQIGFAPIQEITPLGEETVYDIEVEGYHNFIANGVIVHNSEVVYHSISKMLEKKGVIFCDTDTALKKYPEIFKQYFGTVIPAGDNKFAALNTAVWSGGSFIYVPKGVRVDLPLQAYFRINAKNMGQFERTLIIADEGSYVHYVEGCFLKGARVRTKTGEKLIETIREGDEVLTHRGRFRKVYRTMKRPYKGAIYTISVWGDSSAKLEVTSEHPLFVCKRQRKEYRNTSFSPEWQEAKNVEVGDYLVYPLIQKEVEKEIIESETTHIASPVLTRPFIYNYQPQVSLAIPFGHGRHNQTTKTLSISLDENFYRLVGYYLAEGHVDNEHYLTFTFNKKETEYLEDVKSLCLRYFGKDVLVEKERNDGITLTLCSTLAARFFAREFGTTHHLKRIPGWMLESPKNHLKELVKGLWRGDGSFDKKTNMFRYNTVTYSLAVGFRDCLLKLGIVSSLNKQIRVSPKKPKYVNIISRIYSEQFGKIVSVVSHNGRKEGSPFFLDENFLYLPIKTIQKEYQEEMVYNFSVEEDESYVAEGVISHNCTAPIFTTDSLHSAVVEILVKKGARVRYTTIQNWSKNVYNLVTKRMFVEEEGFGEWIDGNLGSQLTMKYPSVFLKGRKARGEILSLAFAGNGQHQDAGGKAIHLAPETSSVITSKSVSKDGGRTSYRGLLKVIKGAENCKSTVRCDALILDQLSRSDTYPTMDIQEERVTIGHEASVSRIGEEQLFYFQSRGIPQAQAEVMIVNGFVEPIVRELPMEYAVELNRLIQLEMTGAVG